MLDYKIVIIILIGTLIHLTAASRENLNLSDPINIWPIETSLEYDIEKRVKSQGWSSWSDWSTCSRTCDGGISNQLRRCHSSSGCVGEPVRYKICNMQPCPDTQDFRLHQCTAYDEVPYDGALFKWTPHYDDSDPCALTCRGNPSHLPDENSNSNEEFDDESNVVVQLATRVQDGTRCRPGSLDMCIQGKCQRVGCDLKIGSTKKVDLCGICGGDGSSCSQPIYQWDTAPMSLCSVTCGGGYKMARTYCRNRVTGTDVEESLCNAATRPEPSVMQCNTHLCPPKWIIEDWGPCSKMCGSGRRERLVFCGEEINGVRTKVYDEVCKTIKPPIQELCNVHECPKWTVTEWSGCSVSCGTGLQIRTVECETKNGQLNTQCDPYTKPDVTQTCSTGISCSREHLEDLNDISNSDNMFGDQPYNSDTDPYHHEHLKSGVYKSNKATFVKDLDWSACSVSCGEGIHKKSYICKIYLEFSKTMATLNDSLCTGPKPLDDIERCIMEPCSLAYSYEESYPKDTYRPTNDNFKVAAAVPGKTYSWREQGYTSCSASCLGGVEDLIINCVRDDTDKVVSPFLCSPETKPEARIRTCNDRPCPPRWNVSEYSACSKSCGIGIKTREVLCIHEVTRGGENTMIVPHNMCPQPPPADRQYCNVLDCPVRWELSEWTKCSKSCGGGIKERKVECKQIMAQEHKVERPPSMCSGIKPPNKKPCNTKPCASESQRPYIAVNNNTYIQHDSSNDKVTLKIGGAATVFYGVQIKIKCPVKKFNRTKIRWSKDYKFLNKTKKIKISKKGALRIINVIFKDAGIYTCHAGLSAADLRLTVKQKPSTDFHSSEEYERHMDVSDIDTFSDNTKQDSEQSSFFIYNNNQSHEQTTSRSKQEQRKNKNRLKAAERNRKMETKEPSHFHSQMTMSEIDPTATSSGSKTPVPHFRHILTTLQCNARNLYIEAISAFSTFLKNNQ